VARIKYFKYGDAETDYLKSRDKVLGAAIDKIGHINRAVEGDLFLALVDSIVGQQISGKAHATIFGRMEANFAPLSPATLVTANAGDIQKCGMSMKKALYIKGIAEAADSGALNLKALKKMSDEEVKGRLVQLKGIGVWTCEMLMIFSLQRPDIVSFNDLGIIRGMKKLYSLDEVTKQEFEKHRSLYSPHASVASLYLWHIAGSEEY
jgi:DNA-3-methyladenine glycosylase II